MSPPRPPAARRGFLPWLRRWGLVVAAMLIVGYFLFMVVVHDCHYNAVLRKLGCAG
jgi:predicted acyltransferase